MTTIAVRGGIMAADCQGTSGTIRSRVDKMFMIGDSAIIGVAGTLSECMVFYHWVTDVLLNDAEEDPPKMEEVEAVILSRKGVYHYAASVMPVRVKDQFFAIGSGAEVALGAMSMGADAKKAVQIASKWDVHTGGRIATMSLDKVAKLK